MPRIDTDLVLRDRHEMAVVLQSLAERIASKARELDRKIGFGTGGDQDALHDAPDDLRDIKNLHERAEVIFRAWHMQCHRDFPSTEDSG